MRRFTILFLITLWVLWAAMASAQPIGSGLKGRVAAAAAAVAADSVFVTITTDTLFVGGDTLIDYSPFTGASWDDSLFTYLPPGRDLDSAITAIQAKVTENDSLRPVIYLGAGHYDFDTAKDISYMALIGIDPGNKSKIHVKSAAYFQLNDYVTMSGLDIYFETSADYGLYYPSIADANDHIKISNCDFTRTSQTPAAFHIIRMWGDNGFKWSYIKDCIFRNNQTGNFGSGIDADGGDGSTFSLDIERCKFYQLDYGIQYTGPGDAGDIASGMFAKLSDCDFNDCDYGIYIDSQGTGHNAIGMIENCRFRGSAVSNLYMYNLNAITIVGKNNSIHRIDWNTTATAGDCWYVDNDGWGRLTLASAGSKTFVADKAYAINGLDYNWDADTRVAGLSDAGPFHNFEPTDSTLTTIIEGDYHIKANGSILEDATPADYSVILNVNGVDVDSVQFSVAASDYGSFSIDHTVLITESDIIKANIRPIGAGSTFTLKSFDLFVKRQAGWDDFRNWADR